MNIKNKKMKYYYKFKDLKFKPHVIGNGVQARFHFDNNYGVSVVKFNGSYGGSSGLYELAVLYKGDITYNTSISDDVIGWLKPEEVSKLMRKIQNLE